VVTRPVRFQLHDDGRPPGACAYQHSRYTTAGTITDCGTSGTAWWDLFYGWRARGFPRGVGPGDLVCPSGKPLSFRRDPEKWQDFSGGVNSEVMFSTYKLCRNFSPSETCSHVSVYSDVPCSMCNWQKSQGRLDLIRKPSGPTFASEFDAIFVAVPKKEASLSTNTCFDSLNRT
jgi:hypothetical protein